MGLSPEEHASLSGLNTSHRSTKELMERYSLEISNNEQSVIVEEVTDVTPIEEENVTDSGQKTLF